AASPPPPPPPQAGEGKSKYAPPLAREGKSKYAPPLAREGKPKYPPPLAGEGREGARSLSGEHDGVENAHGAEQPDVLEGTAETEAGATMGRQSGYVRPIEANGTPSRSHDAVEHIEERCLARTVGTDQRMHGIAADRQIDLVNRLEAPEVLGQTLN